MNSSLSLPASCSRHHYWVRLRAWMTGRQYFHACDVTWTSVTGELMMKDHASWPVFLHGGDITILPDPDLEASDE